MVDSIARTSWSNLRWLIENSLSREYHQLRRNRYDRWWKRARLSSDAKHVSVPHDRRTHVSVAWRLMVLANKSIDSSKPINQSHTYRSSKIFFVFSGSTQRERKRNPSDTSVIALLNDDASHYRFSINRWNVPRFSRFFICSSTILLTYGFLSVSRCIFFILKCLRQTCEAVCGCRLSSDSLPMMFCIWKKYIWFIQLIWDVG